jgi:hypothetical protein
VQAATGYAVGSVRPFGHARSFGASSTTPCSRTTSSGSAPGPQGMCSRASPTRSSPRREPRSPPSA